MLFKRHLGVYCVLLVTLSLEHEEIESKGVASFSRKPGLSGRGRCWWGLHCFLLMLLSLFSCLQL